MMTSSIERAPDLMTPDERRAEIARILARAYLRLRQKKALALSGGEPLLSTAVGHAAPQEGEA